MSHQIQNPSYAAFNFVIINYAVGGETISPLEFGSPTFSGAVFAEVPPGSNSLGVVLFPVLIAGKVQLRQFAGGLFSEIAATVNLNATLVGFIFS